MLATTSCPYCTNIRLPGGSPSGRSSPFDEVLDSGPGCALVPTLGMIVPGYFLIVSVEHTADFAHWEPPALRDLQIYLGARTAQLKTLFGDYIVFEHGSGKRVAPSGACIDHAHLHLIPSGTDFVDEVAGSFQWSVLDGLADLASFRGKPYVLVGNDGAYRAAPVRELVSQWIRREFARWRGLDVSWDWAVYPGSKELAITRSRLEQAGVLRGWNRDSAAAD